ncbi:hypothetical protein LPJ53_004542 [Coemansia erecta]|uniref:Uncharacterized protein n=1 Tax=Coemansia erecta TaxID=147472 RepID=A0A9W7XZJ9_9FUNG|nr:hypothetical protein LPJ53_004542 [Coemansia erecta]
MSIIQYLRNNRLLVVGLVVAPAGLYSGIKIKEWRTQRKIDELKRTVELAESSKADGGAGEARARADNEARIELQGLRAARSMVRREEMLLEQELNSIALKLGRLDEREKKAEIRNESRDK